MSETATATEAKVEPNTKRLQFTWRPESPANLKPIFDRCLVSMATTGLQKVTLVLPGTSKASAQLRRLAGVKSPLGEIVADGDGNTLIVCFNATDILAWMVAKEFCTMQELDSQKAE